MKFEPVEVSWGTAIAALQGNKIDMMSMMDATPERAQAVDFPKTPLLFYSLAVLARDDLPVTTWADLDKPAVRIAVPQASSMDKFLTENVTKAQVSRFPDNAEAIAAFQAGRADAVCLFHPPLLAARQRLGAGKIVVPTPAQSVRHPASPCARRPTSPWSSASTRRSAGSTRAGRRRSGTRSSWSASASTRRPRRR